MKKIFITLFFCIFLLILFICLSDEKNEVEINIVNFNAYDEFIEFDLAIKNTTKKDIIIKNLKTPVDLNFIVKDLGNPFSNIKPLPVSVVGKFEIKLEPNQEKSIEISYLAFLKEGNHNIEILFIDEKSDIIARTMKKIYLKKSISCKNFSSKAAY